MKKVWDKLGNEVRVGDKIMFADLDTSSSDGNGILGELKPEFGEVLSVATHETHFHCGNRHIERLKEPLVHFLNLDGCAEVLPSKNIVSICAIYRNGAESGAAKAQGKAFSGMGFITDRMRAHLSVVEDYLQEVSELVGTRK